jgi:hypothetical protein
MDIQRRRAGLLISPEEVEQAASGGLLCELPGKDLKKTILKKWIRGRYLGDEEVEKASGFWKKEKEDCS